MDFIVAVIVLVVVGASLLYIRKEKKRGVRCVGCPAAGTCSRHSNGTSACSGHADN